MPKRSKIRIELDTYKKNKDVHYKLSEHIKVRRYALDVIIKYESRKNKITIREAAVSKKRRLNVLRLYRKNNYKKQCRIITRDMRYLDKKYNLGITNNIC